ncbi:hypothetical protein KR059_005429, partial [Drosophila kikkawai]
LDYRPTTRSYPHPKLSASLVEIGQSNRHADCCFLIETSFGIRRFACHKLIFSCASEVFDRMLYGDYSEANSGEVRLDDVDPDTFEKFRDYLYGYEYNKLQKYDFETLMQLCEFGNKYLVQSIEEDCVHELLSRKDNYGNAELLQLFQCAHRLNKQNMIEQVGWVLRCKYTSPLTQSGIYEFNPDVFKSYLEVIAGRMREADRFCLLEMYLKHNGIDGIDGSTEAAVPAPAASPGCNSDSEEWGEEVSPTQDLQQLQQIPAAAAATTTSRTILTKEEEKNNYITELVGLINFVRFTPMEFHDGPGQSSFLTLAQKYDFMYKIARNTVPELDLKMGFDSDQ